ncbi:hypothetical protein CK203_066014 [Vitis vinifera]|uniref:Retrotransposon gag domain-containing protein n=1 Tax=Vitis vinifera TaxID=29760 RepID=A0A438G319_VITVI|nr:hypothetical protein CK203_066014 [Vitis vinifera]
MEVTPEDQHSHHGHQDNPNEFRSMRDRMHPPRMSAPSCIVPPIEQLVIRPHIVPLLPTFHGMESENPYAHIKEFEDVCNTFQEGGASIDLMRLKLFPFTLKDKAKIWLNSLRPRTKENEKFYECWERYMEAINACPHHGFDTWLLVSYFYDGMSSSMKQLLETMCGGDFMSKNPEEAMDFLSYVAEVSRGWDEPNKGEAKFAAMTRRLEELELKKMHECKLLLKHQCKIDEMQNDLSQKIDNLQYSISRLTNLNTVQEKGRFPSQPHQNPKGIHEVETHERESSQYGVFPPEFARYMPQAGSWEPQDGSQLRSPARIAFCCEVISQPFLSVCEISQTPFSLAKWSLEHPDICYRHWEIFSIRFLLSKSQNTPYQIIRKCVPEEEQQGILSHCHENACGGHFASQKIAMKVLQSGFCWHHFSKMPTPCVGAVIDAKGSGSLQEEIKCL